MSYTSYIPKTIDDFNKYTELSLIAIGILVKEGAIKICPVAEVNGGTLRQSIDYAISIYEKTVEIGANTKYAEFVEFGTRYMDAQPYLTPAFEDNIDRIKKLVEDYFNGLNS